MNEVVSKILFSLIAVLTVSNSVSYNAAAQIFPVSLNFPLLFLSISLGILLFSKVFSLPRNVFLYIGFIFFYLFFGLFTGSLQNTVPTEVIVIDLVKAILISLVIFIVIVKYFCDKNQFKFINNLTTIILLISGIVAVWGLVTQFHFATGFSGVDVGWDIVSRASGWFLNPNTMGYMMCFGMCIALSRYKFEGKKWGHLLLVIIFWCLGLATFSKTFILTSLLIFSYLLLDLMKSKSFFRLRTTLKFLYTVFFLGIILLFGKASSLDVNEFVTEEQFDRISVIYKILDTTNKEDVTTSRSGVLEVAISKIVKKPLQGYGLGAFNYIKETAVVHHGVPQGVHNQYALVLGNSGILSFFFFFLVILSLFVPKNVLNAPKDKKMDFLFKTLMISFLFFCLTSHNMFESIPTIFVLAYIFAISNMRYNANGFNENSKLILL